MTQELTRTQPERLRSEEVIVHSPFSVIGASKRVWRATERVAERAPESGWLRWLALGATYTVGLTVAVLAATLTLSVTVAYWPIMVPIKWAMRGSAKRERGARQHRELVERLERNSR